MAKKPEAKKEDPAAAAPESAGRVVIGRVVSNKMDKTITVRIDRQITHPVYGKMLRRSTKLKAHDANNECKEGDLVSIRECRPISATKHWMLVKVLEKSKEIASVEV